MKYSIKILVACFLLTLLVSAQKEEIVTYDGGKFQIVCAPSSLVHLHWKDSEGERYRNFQRLHKDLMSKGVPPFMITNAGLYERDLIPCGLHLEKGKTLSPLNLDDGNGNFYLKPNGVFFIRNGEAGITNTQNFSLKDTPCQLAVQSGPLLLEDGKIHPKFNRESTSKLLRSGVGVSKSGEVIFAISQGKVNFHHFARLFQHLGCPHALFLDGTISQMHLGGEEPASGQTDFSAMFAVYSEKSP